MYQDVRYAHASLGCLAWVIFFPAGAILVRVATFRGVVWWHAGLQAFAYALFVVNVGTGIWMSNETSQVRLVSHTVSTGPNVAASQYLYYI
jgi:hypothetical protein